MRKRHHWKTQFVEVLLTIDNIEEKSKKENKYIASKLHKQSGLPKSARLLDLIKTARIPDTDLLDIVKDLDKSCQICMRHKRRSSRPVVVGFSLAHDFNETVAIYLKQFRSIYILHMVDHARMYSASAITIIERKLLLIRFSILDRDIWNTYLFLSDNRGEFNNDLFREMGEQLNINTKTTAAESPWSNDITEKQNGKWKKVKSDVGFSLEVAQTWCICAKNLLLNSYVYSPISWHSAAIQIPHQ